MVTFSIITPSFNQGCYIEETIKSIWSQAGNFKIEHLVKDGSSSDKTTTVLKKYEKLLQQKKYPVKCKGISFIWTSRKDKGQSDAINQGLKEASGEILAYLNSDDAYEPGAFTRALNTLRKKEVNLIYSDCYIIDGQSKVTGILKGKTFTLDTYLNENNYIPQPTVFFKRKLYKALGDFNQDYHYAMDYDYFIRAAKRFKVSYLAGKPLARFRIYQDSKSVSQQSKSWHEARGICLKHGGKFFSQAFFAYYRAQFRFFIKDSFGFDPEPSLVDLSQIKQRGVNR